MPDWLIWLIVSGALAAAELASGALVLIMIAGGAAVAAVAAGIGVPVAVQVVLALVATALLLAGVRPVAVRHMNPDPVTMTNAEALVGREAVVLRPVTRDEGRVRLNGAEWSARAMDPKQDLPVGSEVTVVAIDGATAVVWRDPFR